jgi:hypothetical protein
MHDIAKQLVAAQVIGHHFAKGPGEKALIKFAYGLVNVFL